MLPLVRVGAAMRADVVTSTKLFEMRYNITSLASARLLARDTQFKLSSMVFTLLESLNWVRCDQVASLEEIMYPTNVSAAM